MDELGETFDLVLKKHSARKSIYSDNVTKNHTLKPQDVLSSVSSQIKAIQVADSIKISNKQPKHLNNLKKSSYVPVNKLKVFDAPATTNTKFDMQCVTDTQLINLIEDAEILDVHRGMTQEFDTSFSHLITENETKVLDKHITLGLDNKSTCADEEVSKECAAIMDTGQNIGDTNTNVGQCEIESNNFNDGSKIMNEIEEINLNKQVQLDANIIFEQKDIEGEELSQILTAKTVKTNPKFKSNDLVDRNNIAVENDKQIEEPAQILNLCVEIDINENSDRPPSPIFINKNTKTTSKPSSPLVFALEKFEHFENITLPLLESSNFNAAKCVINSQIIDKELCLKVNNKIELNEGGSLSPVDQRNNTEEANLGLLTDTDLKIIEIDKATSENVLKQLTYQNSKSEKSLDPFKDEILFSSDEEDNYIQKEYQDLPFTCALETSFYEQSDILDKTMYVGFQTASNRSIQIGTSSFVKAKNIFNEINTDDISMTELVKTCDSFVKDTSKVGQVICDIGKDSGLNLAKKAENLEHNDVKEKPVNITEPKNEIHKDNNTTVPPENTNFIGFVTANNNKIKLSDKALARCKKIFHDIDLNENFGSVNDKDNSLAMSEDFKNKNKVCADDNKEKLVKEDIKGYDDDLQSIDDEIIQEFENIEMSLEDDKPDKEAKTIGFRTASNKNIKISDGVLDKMKHIFKDINFDEDFIDNNNEHLKAEDVVLSQIISHNNERVETKVGTRDNITRDQNINIPNKSSTTSKNEFDSIYNTELLNKLPKTLNTESNVNQPLTNINKFKGFKTANNKSIIISHDALVKSKDIFKDIDRKSSVEILDENVTAANPQPSISKGFVGFKTANNKAIKISENAWSKTKNIFNDINSTELPKKEIKDYPKITENNIKSKNSSMGFKTTNNNSIHISKEALAKTKNICNDIDSLDFKNIVINKNSQKNIEKPKASISQITKEITVTAGLKTVSSTELKMSSKNLSQTKNNFKEDRDSIIERPKTPETHFIGFRTANNKGIQISNEALTKTKNIFKDIDSTDFKLPNTSKKEYPDFGNTHKIEESNESSAINYRIQASFDAETNVSKFQGFKTASNKQVKVSSEALIKSKNVFKDIDKNFEYNIEDKTANKKIYPTDINHDDTKTKLKNTAFKGFQTANEESVTVSVKAFEESKKIFEEFELERPNETDSRFSGFQTASNKQVKISREAIAKSRNLFKDISFNHNVNADTKTTKKKALYPEEIYQNDEFLNGENKKTSSVFKGFHKASKKPAAITKSALEESKEIFQDIHKKNECFGFQTASNKIVKISEKTLAESKKLLDIDSPENNSFKGFQTANNKTVKISKEALAKTKKTFQDTDTVDKSNIKKHEHLNFAFQTGNNNAITVSKEALAKSKRLFSEIDDQSENINNKKEKKDPICNTNADIHAIIDTQVISNFEESLHTEDFYSTPNANKCKRSGSPILSCPRAKKRRKFETPYNNKVILKPVIDTNATVINENTITYSENYKKNKQYTLKDLANITKDITVPIDPYLTNFDFDNILQFEFKYERNDISEEHMTTESLKEKFLNSINSKLVPNGWLDNHLKMILWKLISYEVKFKSAVICTARNVIDQLKYRYDRELYNAQRPALRKIFEKDDVTSKTMVLCVVGVYVDGVRVKSVTNNQSNIELLLTDGWYCIRGSIDPMLMQLVCSNKIIVGSKIVTCGAELSGGEQAVAPWEDTSSFCLKIFGNSTRRARWDARLGYHGNAAILCSLSSVNVMGGKISKMRVFVTRVYPALYVEKFEDGSTVTRSERLENIHQMKVETERQAFMEKLYEEVEKEFADQESQDSEGVSDSCKGYMDTGSQIAELMNKCKDPAEFRAQLTASQSHLLEAHTSKKRERLLQDIQKRIQERVDKAGVCINRNVIPLLKIRVAGVREKGDSVEVSKGMMSIWKPNDALQEIIKEGAWIEVLNVVPTAVRYSEIQISAGRQSVFSTSKFKPSEKIKLYTNNLQRQCYPIKDLTQNPSLSTNYNEIDTVGLIFLIDPSNNDFESIKHPFQNVYLTDADKNIICVNFWGGLKKFGYQNVLDTGQLITCVNLQKRAGNTRKSIPQYRVTEFSYFTQTPKNSNSKILLDELNKKFLSLDRRKFCLDCVVLKNNYSVIKQNNENVSPYRIINTDINMSKNKVFIDSPLVRQNMDDIFNLTGLDFESTFKQDTQLSEELLKRKRKVNEKIAKLKMYGEPPPLSPIHIINKSKQASSSYKSPLLSNIINTSVNSEKSSSDSSKLNVKYDSFKNVATEQKTPQKCGEKCDISNSPILLNRTYVKSINPVKINFDVKDNNDSIDHFAEEFDGSPPLSLD